MPSLDDEQIAQLGPVGGEVRAQRQGRMPELYRVLLNSPAVARGWLAFFTALRQETKLSDALRELAILRVAQLTGAAYEFRSHVPFAAAAGLSDEKIAQLASWRATQIYTPAERLVLAYAEELTQRIEVPDETFSPLATVFDHQEILELTTVIAAYGLVARVSETLQVGH